MGEFGDFQEGVGKMSGRIEDVIGKIFAVLFFLTAIVVAFFAITQTSFEWIFM